MRIALDHRKAQGIAALHRRQMGDLVPASRSSRAFPYALLLLILASMACRAALIPSRPTAQPTARPSATSSPFPTRTKTLTPTPTEKPVGEFQFGEIVAVDYQRADWQNNGSALGHRTLPGCTVAASGGSDFPSELPESIIGGFTWLTRDNIYLLKIGDQIAGDIEIQFGEEKTDCRKAIETLLKTLHAPQDYAQTGNCLDAPKQRLKVGDTAVALTSSYLRSAPRWAEDTRVRLVKPAEKLEIKIVGGPVCAIYGSGEYSYWQVVLSSGERGWMAEGDLEEYYLGLKK